ncbi:MAG: hypothetical protein U5L46_01730 [Agrobacterium sp.]|nr:hypothetical protein [Agrobacterium sp.]
MARMREKSNSLPPATFRGIARHSLVCHVPAAIWHVRDLYADCPEDDDGSSLRDRRQPWAISSVETVREGHFDGEADGMRAGLAYFAPRTLRSGQITASPFSAIADPALPVLNWLKLPDIGGYERCHRDGGQYRCDGRQHPQRSFQVAATRPPQRKARDRRLATGILTHRE